MSRRPPPSTDVAAEAAIARVLAVERDARDDVTRASSDASAIIESSRNAARAIAERAERRIRRVREAFADHAARQIAAIDAEVAAQDAARELSPDDLLRLERAVAALSIELTSAPP